MAVRLVVIVSFLVSLTTQVAAQQFVYVWSGPALTSTSGTVSPGSAVTGSFVLEGPIENLPLAEITPVSFSFSVGPVTIDDGTPLHPFTTFQVETNASGEIVDAVIQLVEEGDASAMGGGLFAADVICVESCDTNDTGDFVIDRNETANVIGMGSVAPGGSFWSTPSVVPPATVPAMSPVGAGLLLSALSITGWMAGFRARRSKRRRAAE